MFFGAVPGWVSGQGGVGDECDGADGADGDWRGRAISGSGTRLVTRFAHSIRNSSTAHPIPTSAFPFLADPAPSPQPHHNPSSSLDQRPFLQGVHQHESVEKRRSSMSRPKWHLGIP